MVLSLRSRGSLRISPSNLRAKVEIFICFSVKTTFLHNAVVSQTTHDDVTKWDDISCWKHQFCRRHCYLKSAYCHVKTLHLLRNKTTFYDKLDFCINGNELVFCDNVLLESCNCIANSAIVIRCLCLSVCRLSVYLWRECIVMKPLKIGSCSFTWNVAHCLDSLSAEFDDKIRRESP